jgi:8-oxo-dGTP diphosphatase
VVERREYPERPVLGVAGVVISHGRVLLIRRGHPPLEGQWSIPGGMLELGETVMEGVRRELFEETGIEARATQLVEVFERISLDDAGKPKYHFVVLDYLCERIRGEARAGSDAQEVFWAAETDLARYALTPEAENVIRKAFAMARGRAG